MPRSPEPPDPDLQGAFVTGTGTEVGKTIVAGVIARATAARGARVCVFKPAVSGLGEAHAEGGASPDHEHLRAAAGSKQSDDEIAPYRYGPAVSPHLAAELAGEEIDPARLIGAARAAGEAADFLVCEGVGGLLVPLRADYLVRDFALELGLPLVVVASPGLGTINHTLLTLEAARAVGLKVTAVVLTPWPKAPSEMEASNRETIEDLAGVPVKTLGMVRPTEPETWPVLSL